MGVSTQSLLLPVEFQASSNSREIAPPLFVTLPSSSASPPPSPPAPETGADLRERLDPSPLWALSIRNTSDSGFLTQPEETGMCECYYIVFGGCLKNTLSALTIRGDTRGRSWRGVCVITKVAERLYLVSV